LGVISHFNGFREIRRPGLARRPLRRAGTVLHGEPRDGRGNASFRDLLAEPQVPDLRRFLALTLPFPD
jgi:hypothetical protein